MFTRKKKPQTKMFTLRLTADELLAVKKLQKLLETKTLSQTVRICVDMALRNKG